jgi:WD40 repeat protein
MSESDHHSKKLSPEAVFEQALTREESDRAGYLDQACREDTRLRARVEVLLAAHGDESGFLPEGDSIETVATLSSERGEVERFDLPNSTRSRFSVASGTPGQMDHPTAMTVFGSPAMILLGRSNGALEIWNPLTESMVESWDVSSQPIEGIKTSLDGSLAAVRTDRGVDIFDLEKKTVKNHLAVSDGMILIGGLSFGIGGFSPNGSHIASRGSNQEVIVWNVETGGPIRELMFDQRDEVRSIAFSPDGVFLAAGSTDTNLVKVWRTDTWEPQAELEGHIQGVADIEFSRDSRTIATGSADRTVTLWHLETQQELLTIPFEGPVARVKFTPDERYMIVSSLDLDGPMIRVWEIPTVEEIAAWE